MNQLQLRSRYSLINDNLLPRDDIAMNGEAVHTGTKIESTHPSVSYELVTLFSTVRRGCEALRSSSLLVSERQ